MNSEKHITVGKTMIFGTPGKIEAALHDLEKIFRNPEAFNDTMKREHSVLTEKLQEAVDSIRPYDMLEEDYYQHLINMEHLHCGPHAKDSPEGKWMQHYLTNRVLARR